MPKVLKVLIVEDNGEFAQALKTVLSQATFPFICEVEILNPDIEPRPTFEQAMDKAEESFVVLLDNQLGRWRWSGANMAPSLNCVVNISSEAHPWTQFHFGRKFEIAVRDSAEAKAEFLTVMESAFREWRLIT